MTTRYCRAIGMTPLESMLKYAARDPFVFQLRPSLVRGHRLGCFARGIWRKLRASTNVTRRELADSSFEQCKARTERKAGKAEVGELVFMRMDGKYVQA